jgi:hypothetical protein
MKQSLISDDECRRLVKSLKDGAEPDHAATLVVWAERTRLNAELLALVLKGRARTSIDPTGEVRFYKDAS